jgi:hypothetical protein
MADNYYVNPVPPFHPAVGASFGTFTAFQDVSPVPKPFIYGGSLRPGSEIEVEAWGEFSTTGTPTMSLGFFWGAVGVVLAQSNLAATGSGAAAWQWHLKYCGRITATGTSGSIVGQGILDLSTSLTAMNTAPIPITQALRTVTIDTTVNKDIGVGAQFGTSSASNTVRVNDLRAMVLN